MRKAKEEAKEKISEFYHPKRKKVNVSPSTSSSSSPEHDNPKLHKIDEPHNADSDEEFLSTNESINSTFETLQNLSSSEDKTLMDSKKTMSPEELNQLKVMLNKPHKHSLVREVAIIPEFNRKNFVKFLACAKQFNDALKDEFEAKDIVATISTKFNEKDYLLYSSQNIKTFDELHEFVTHLGTLNRSSSAVLADILLLKQQNQESLLDYAVRADQLKMEFDLAEKVSNLEPLFTNEAFKALIAKSTFNGLKPIYRSKIPQNQQTYEALREFMHARNNELFSTTNRSALSYQTDSQPHNRVIIPSNTFKKNFQNKNFSNRRNFFPTNFNKPNFTSIQQRNFSKPPQSFQGYRNYSNFNDSNHYQRNYRQQENTDSTSNNSNNLPNNRYGNRDQRHYDANNTDKTRNRVQNFNNQKQSPYNLNHEFNMLNINARKNDSYAKKYQHRTKNKRN